MITQTTIPFNVLVPQNNRESENILLLSEKRLSHNCQVLYDAFKRGERLTGKDIVLKYGMSEYRKRICNLREAGIEIKEEILPGGCKRWWI